MSPSGCVAGSASCVHCVVSGVNVTAIAHPCTPPSWKKCDRMTGNMRATARSAKRVCDCRTSGDKATRVVQRIEQRGLQRWHLPLPHLPPLPQSESNPHLPYSAAPEGGAAVANASVKPSEPRRTSSVFRMRNSKGANHEAFPPAAPFPVLGARTLARSLREESRRRCSRRTSRSGT